MHKTTLNIWLRQDSWMPPLFTYDKIRHKPSKSPFFASWMISWTVLMPWSSWRKHLLSKLGLSFSPSPRSLKFTHPEPQQTYRTSLTLHPRNSLTSEWNFLGSTVSSSRLSTCSSHLPSALYVRPCSCLSRKEMTFSTGTLGLLQISWLEHSPCCNSSPPAFLNPVQAE